MAKRTTRNPKVKLTHREKVMLAIAANAWASDRGPTNYSGEERAAARSLIKKGLLEKVREEKWEGVSVLFAQLTPDGRRMMAEHIASAEEAGARLREQAEHERKYLESIGVRRKNAAPGLGNPMTRRKNARTPFDNMAWHSDPLVRDIGSVLGDEDDNPYDVAEAVMEVWEQYDRGFEEPEESGRLTRDEAEEATVLADAIVNWANYGIAYGDYSGVPWEEYESNPRGKKGKKRRPNPSTHDLARKLSPIMSQRKKNAALGSGRALTKSDKRVIEAFLEGMEYDSSKLYTDGKQLDGLWMGGSKLAYREGGKIVLPDVGSRAAQQVQKAVRKATPKNWLASNPYLTEEDVLTEIVLIAVNDGDAYRDKQNAARAVKSAIREYLRLSASDARETAAMVEKQAIKEVKKQWRDSNPGEGRGRKSNPSSTHDLARKLTL